MTIFLWSLSQNRHSDPASFRWHHQGALRGRYTRGEKSTLYSRMIADTKRFLMSEGDTRHSWRYTRHLVRPTVHSRIPREVLRRLIFVRFCSRTRKVFPRWKLTEWIRDERKDITWGKEVNKVSTNFSLMIRRAWSIIFDSSLVKNPYKMNENSIVSSTADGRNHPWISNSLEERSSTRDLKCKRPGRYWFLTAQIPQGCVLSADQELPLQC